MDSGPSYVIGRVGHEQQFTIAQFYQPALIDRFYFGRNSKSEAWATPMREH